MKPRRFLAILGAGVCALALAANAQERQPQRLRVGGEVMKAKLVQQVEPVYPPLAKNARIQGTVRLQVVISPEGSVDEMTVMSGHPLLVQQAMEAVRLWRYEPTLLNGAPVSVVSTVDVLFSLNGGDTAEPSESVEIPPSFEADVRRLLDVTGAHKSWSQLAKATVESAQSRLVGELPPGTRGQQIFARFTQKLNAALDSDEYVKAIIAFYATRFSQEDVIELIRFFETPTGHRFASVMPQLNRALTAASEARLQFEVSRILRELKEEFPELKKP
jgi:TonB family protein